MEKTLLQIIQENAKTDPDEEVKQGENEEKFFISTQDIKKIFNTLSVWSKVKETVGGFD